MEWIFVVLALLFVKHWYVDFIDQTAEEIEHKGNYLDWLGIKHSLKHGLGTAIVLFAVTTLDFETAVFFGALDFIFHYHIDWAKININKENNYTVETPKFWQWLGADQLAHNLTYLFIVWAIV